MPSEPWLSIPPSACACRKNQWCERLVFSVFRAPRDTAPLLIRADSRTHRLETRNRGETQRPTGRDAATPPGNLSAAASRISDWEAIETTPDRACLLLQRRQGSDEFRCHPHNVAKTLDVRDGLLRLNGKLEAGRSCCNPILKQFLGWQASKSVVDFHSVETAGVVVQELGGIELCRVKVRLPSRVRPTRGARIDLFHRTSPFQGVVGSHPRPRRTWPAAAPVSFP